MGKPRESARTPIINGEKQKSRSDELSIIETASKLPVSQQVVERLNKLKFCPVTKLVDLAKNATSQYVQLEASKSLLDKVAPSLKAVEIEGNSASNGYVLNIYYSKSAAEISQDPFNNVLSQMKKVSHDN